MMTRRQFGYVLATAGCSAALSGCENFKTPTSSTPPPQGTNPAPQPTTITLSQRLERDRHTYSFECHRTHGMGLTTYDGQRGGYIVLINGTAIGMESSGSINLANWPVRSTDRVEVQRVSNTAVVSTTNRC